MLPYWSRPNLAWDSTHMVYADTSNFIWMCSMCRLLVAKNHSSWQILTSGDSCTNPFTDDGQIWCARADSQYMLTYQISSWLVYSVTLWQRKTLTFTILSTLAFCGVATWWQSEKVEHRCTATNLPLPNGIKIVSVFHWHHGKIGHTNSDIEKHNGQTDKQSDRQTTFFCCPGGWNPSPTKLGMVTENLEHVLAPPKLLVYGV